MYKRKKCFLPRFAAALLMFAAMVPAVCLLASCYRQTSFGPPEGNLGPGGSRRWVPGTQAELRYGLGTEPVTLDPLSPANTADGRSILFNIFEGLVKSNSEGSLIPAVAESYRVEDALVYVFTIREGIRFHDGKELMPEDVAFSLNTAAKAGFTGLNRIAEIEVSGPREIRVRLTEPDPEFLPYLTVGIVQEDNPDREKNPIGTGPFIIESYTPQQYLRLVKNPLYWQKDLPGLDRVTIVFVADTDALLTGLRGGNIEGATITGALLHQLDLKRFDIIPWYSNTVQLLALNNAHKPLDDVRVRRAVNYALDIQRIIDTAFYGQGEPSGSPVIPGLKNVYEESLRDPYPQDIEKAKALLAEAGYPDGFPLEIAVPSNYTMHVDTAQVIVNQRAAAGINATIRLVDWATWLSEIYRERRYQATIISFDAHNVSPRSFLARYVSGASGNLINFRNQDFDRVYNAALVEGDEEKRNALYKEAQRIVSENAASVYIQDIMGFWVFSDGRFGGVINYPLYVIDFAYMYRK
jgi:peptide/nickel transport system substrate-binding protein